MQNSEAMVVILINLYSYHGQALTATALLLSGGEMEGEREREREREREKRERERKKARVRGSDIESLQSCYCVTITYNQSTLLIDCENQVQVITHQVI